jgi:hypothetical protein
MAYRSGGTPHGSRGVQNPLKLAPLVVFIQPDGADAAAKSASWDFPLSKLWLLLPPSKGLGLSD